MIAGTPPGARGTGVPGPPARFEYFRLTYRSGTVVDAYYGDGATLGEVRVTHPLAVVEAVEEFIGRREITP